MKHASSLAAIGVAAALALGLSGCGDDPVPNGAAASAATVDVAFAQAMIPHHQQAVMMADLALDPGSQASAAVRDLASGIRAAQDPEIGQMTMWLEGWGQPTAMPGAGSPHDMMGMDHDMGGMVVSGMMSDEDMATLSGLTGADFDTAWLRMMIEHHEGAVDMAQQAARATSDPRVETLANEIISAQQSEIATMQGLLP